MRPVIVGAGPVGLSAALFLAHHGIRTRILEAHDSPSPYSRALAVNPRTLSLLESTGVTSELLKHGQKVQAANIHLGDETLAHVKLEDLDTPFPFMLALSQATTEKIITRALERFGIEVERGAAMVGCRQRFANVETRIKHKNREGVEAYDAPWVFAADGAHSHMRDLLKVAFKGSTFKERWNLADVPLETPRALNEAHIDFLPEGGFLLLIPVYSDEDIYQTPTRVWRVLGNVENPLEHLRETDRVAGPAIWQTSFAISHRYADKMTVGCVHFAGDSAHVHSPLGARGMNLGIEDAWVFAKAAAEGRMDTYAKLREPVDRAVVKRIELFSRIVRGRTPLTRFMRQRIFPRFMQMRLMSGQMKSVLTGLDHDLPEILSHRLDSFAIPSPL